MFLGENTLFGLPKVDAFSNHRFKIIIYNRTAQPKCSNLCYTFYGRPFCEPRTVGSLCWLHEGS